MKSNATLPETVQLDRAFWLEGLTAFMLFTMVFLAWFLLACLATPTPNPQGKYNDGNQDTQGQ